MSPYILLIISALLNGIAQICWKYGLNEPLIGSFSEKIIALLTNISFMGGFFLYGVSIILWIIVLSRVEVSFAYPLLSLSYIVVIFGGYFLGEELNLTRIFGVFCIMVGIFFIARS